MPELITLPRFGDHRGNLTVIEKCLPFDIQRVYWLSDFHTNERGGHRHLKTVQAAICLQGSCQFTLKKYGAIESVVLDSPQQCLILEPEDWHIIENGKDNPIILMLASEHYDQNDYKMEPLV